MGEPKENTSASPTARKKSERNGGGRGTRVNGLFISVERLDAHIHTCVLGVPGCSVVRVREHRGWSTTPLLISWRWLESLHQMPRSL